MHRHAKNVASFPIANVCVELHMFYRIVMYNVKEALRALQNQNANSS